MQVCETLNLLMLLQTQFKPEFHASFFFFVWAQMTALAYLRASHI